MGTFINGLADFVSRRVLVVQPSEWIMYRSLGDGQILPTFALARPLRAGMVHLSRIDRRYLFDAKATPTHPDRARRPARVMQWQRYCGGGYWQRKWGTKLRWRTDHFDRRCSSRRWCSIRDARSCHRHHSSDRTRGERHRARSDKLCWQIPVRRGLWCFLERTPNGQSGKPEDRDRRLRTRGDGDAWRSFRSDRDIPG